MKKLISLGCAMLLAFAATQALAESSSLTPTAAAPAAPPPCTPAKQIYALKHWRRAHPARGANVCPARARDLRELKERYGEYRLYRAVAPFRGPIGHGPRSPADQRYWAVPWCVVAGESGGDFYESNGDGAYQIIPSTWAAHGGARYSSQASDATALEQHIVAHRAARAGEPWYGGCGFN